MARLPKGVVKPKFGYTLYFTPSARFPEGYQENDSTRQQRALRRIAAETTVAAAAAAASGAAASVTTLSKELAPEEYASVWQQFVDTAPRKTITKIEKVHHPALLASYTTYRDVMVAPSNNGNPNELRLFHGTDATTIKKVTSGSNQCFDRAYSTTHRYGKGVYFARDARYSASTSYSTCDDDGKQRMILCSVAVGASTRGTKGMLAPPERCSETSMLYDSTVDDTSNPAIYVVYNDAAAYPDYIITFE